MAGATKVQTKAGKGRSPESWYGGGSQAASMSAQHDDVLELAGARQPRGGTVPTLHKSAPGEPGVSGRRWSKSLGSGTHKAPMAGDQRTRAGQPGPGSRRRGGTATRNPQAVQHMHPAQPGVTGKLASRTSLGSPVKAAGKGPNAPRPTPLTGINPGESKAGSSGVSRAKANQGPEQAAVHALVPLAKRLGAKMTTRHLQNAAAAASGRDYRAGVTHLSRAHDTARRDGNVQLMNAIQKAQGMMRQATP